MSRIPKKRIPSVKKVEKVENSIVMESDDDDNDDKPLAQLFAAKRIDKKKDYDSDDE